MFSNIYKGKKVLITGHTGFKGAWLTLWLLELGARVVGYSLKPPTTPNLFSILNLKNKITHIIGDVRDKNKLLLTLQEYKPDIIFHLAAQSLVRESYKEPVLTYETNIMGTVNLLEAIRKTSAVKVLINITTDKVYENKEWIYGYRENEPLGGYDPYSSSKACSEIVTSSFRNAFFNPEEYGKKHNVAIATVRAGNVIGGGDWAKDRLIPDIVKSLSEGKTIIIRNPESVRPWQYVLEPLNGYLLLGELLYKGNIQYSGAWNFGPEYLDTITVKELVEQAIQLWGSGEYRIEKEVGKHEAKLLRLDITKSSMLLHWEPKYGIKTAIERTIQWYKSYYTGKEDMYVYSVEEIKKFGKKNE